MSKKLPPLDDNFFSDPIEAVNELINEIVRERSPYMVQAVYIKSECNSVVLEVSGERRRLAKNRCLFVPSQTKTGEVVEADSRHLYSL